MTIRELWEWAKEHKAEDYEIDIQYRGYYHGYDSDVEPEIKSEGKEVIL